MTQNPLLRNIERRIEGKFSFDASHDQLLLTFLWTTEKYSIFFATKKANNISPSTYL
jgi:hypothetical protein